MEVDKKGPSSKKERDYAPLENEIEGFKQVALKVCPFPPDLDLPIVVRVTISVI